MSDSTYVNQSKDNRELQETCFKAKAVNQKKYEIDYVETMFHVKQCLNWAKDT